MENDRRMSYSRGAAKRKAPQPPLQVFKPVAGRNVQNFNSQQQGAPFIFYDTDQPCPPNESSTPRRNWSRSSNIMCNGHTPPDEGVDQSSCDSSRNDPAPADHATVPKFNPVTPILPTAFPPPEHYERHDQLMTIMSLQVQNKVSMR